MPSLSATINPPAKPPRRHAATPPQDGPVAQPPDYGPSPRNLRLIEITGWTLFAAWASTLVIIGIIQPEPYAHGWRLVLELAFLGHVLNAADGISNGFSREYLIFQCGLQDIILVLVAYPWVVRAYHGIQTRGLIGKTIDNFRTSAERHHRIVEPFGAIGLWVFVLFPFWGTGALVGSVVGYLLGLRTWVTFTAVFSGHLVGVTTAVLFFDAIEDWLRTFDRSLVAFLPWIVVTLLTLVWFASGAWRQYRLRSGRAEK